MDDIFDVYGTLDELVLFTDAINKWDLKAMETLPHQMKLVYRAVYDTTNEISHKVLGKHGWDPSNSLRKAWISLCNAFLVEAKWFSSGYVPTAEEYLKNGIISSGVHVVFAHTFFLLGEGITKESIQLIDQTPSQVSTVAAILRLWDDLGSAKDENQEGYDGSYIECFMKDNRSCTLEGAREHVVGLISNEWKRLNKEYCFSPNHLPKSFIKATFNFARMVSLMYNYDNKQRLPSLEKYINSMLYN
ncbi:hypothetical protein Syun_010334 [Stephania yunnanensis]|uniref:Terpene synthase metal-binding domain-containing protein n=1 Tax=Stephania yunnanensis TaxID=152371 RepID=A0AAP0KIW9_9MAGN